MMTVRYKTRTDRGVESFEFRGVASWSDETSPHDSFVLRVFRDAEGRAIAGPQVGYFWDFEQIQEA